MTATSVTISARGVILTGQTSVDVNICLPICPSKLEFLVQSVHVGPEVIIGATSIDVINLPRWAVSVPVYQLFSNPGAAVQVALTALAQGAEHITATIPAGQTVKPAGLYSVPITITLLGGDPATRRFEFNVHLTGICRKPFVCSQTNRTARKRGARSNK